MMVLQ
jgi:hypothetical protein